MGSVQEITGYRSLKDEAIEEQNWRREVGQTETENGGVHAI
jgi:hypothetical protein